MDRDPQASGQVSTALEQLAPAELARIDAPALAELGLLVEGEVESGYLVADAAGRERATEALALVRGALKHIEEQRKGAVKPLNDQVRGINAAASESAAPFLRADVTLAARISAWIIAERERVEVERRRQEAERQRAEQAAREAERQRQEAERVAAETVRAAAELERQAAAAPSLGEFLGVQPQLEIAEAQAEEARDIADVATEAAHAAVEAIPHVFAPAAPAKTVATASGAAGTLRDDYTWEVDNIDLVPRKYLSIDAAAVSRAVRTDKVRSIPGIRIFPRPSVAITQGKRRR